MQKSDISENTYDQCEKHDYLVINIKQIEQGAFHQGSNYQSILFNLQTKVAFALFVIFTGSCWLGSNGNYNKVSNMATKNPYTTPTMKFETFF